MRLLFLLLPILACAYETVLLEELDLSAARIVQHRNYKRQTRTIYLDGEQYIKVWPKEYFYTCYFLLGLESGFFEEITSLTGVIYDQDGECRGYIAKKCQNFAEGIFLKTTQKNNTPTLLSIEQQPEAFREFYKQLIARSRQTKLAHIDFLASNVVYDAEEDCYYLIDLESIRPLNELKKEKNRGHILATSLPEYRTFLMTFFPKK